MSRQLRSGLAAFALLTACGGGGGGELLPPIDAGGPDGAADAAVTAPAPPAEPAGLVFGDCPDGWRAAGAVCEPWPEEGPSVCGVDQAHFPGTTGCARVGTACPADGAWAPDLPTDGPVRFVRPGAVAGDGSRAAPFGTISEAMRGAAAGTVVALAAGTYDSAVRLPAGVTLWGACTAETVIAPSFESDMAGAVFADGLGCGVRNLRIEGERPGLSADGDVSLDVRDVVVSGVRVVGIASFRGAAVTGEGIVVRDTRANGGGSLGRGIDVEFGGTLSLARVSLERNRDFGVMVAGAGARATLADVAVRDTRAQDDYRHGRGLNVIEGGALEVLRGALEGNAMHGALVTQEGSSLRLDTVVVRDTKPEPATAQLGLGVAVEGGASATLSRVLVDRAMEAGVNVSRSTLTATDLVVRETLPQNVTGIAGMGLTASEGARVTLERARLEGNHTVAISLRGVDTVSTLSDLVVADTRARESDGALGVGVGMIEGSRTELARVLVSGGDGYGYYVFGEGTSATLTDVAAVDTGTGTAAGHGIQVAGGATATVSRARFDGTSDLGAVVGGAGSSLTLEDVLVTGVRTITDAEGITYAAGVQVEDGGRLSIARGLVAGCALRGIGALGASTLSLADVVVEDTQPSPEGGLGRGLVLGDGSTAEVVHARFSRNAEVAVAAFDMGTRIHLTDVTVEDTRASQPRGDTGRALSVDFGAAVELDDVRMLRNREASVWASGAGTEVVGRRVTIRETALWDCDAERCSSGGVGVIVLAGARVALDAFLIEDNAFCGAQIDEGSDLELSDGVVSGHAIGLNFQGTGHDLERVTQGVTFRDNDRNIDTNVLPIPDTGLDFGGRSAAGTGEL